MDLSDPKDQLHHYLRTAREAVVWKLEGVGEYDARRPLVRSGTNLLGLVKHLAGVEAGYFGAVFDRPFPEPLPWMEPGSEPNADMWATADEPRAEVLSLYGRVQAHADATIGALDLDAPGQVPWWGEHGAVTLRMVLIHVATETHRHAGHADIVRELIDGATGFKAGSLNLPDEDASWWTAHHDRLERVAREAAER